VAVPLRSEAIGGCELNGDLVHPESKPGSDALQNAFFDDPSLDGMLIQTDVVFGMTHAGGESGMNNAI
jgi:hypothetical protein